MRIFIALSVLLVLSAASRGRKRSRDSDDEDDSFDGRPGDLSPYGQNVRSRFSRSVPEMELVVEEQVEGGAEKENEEGKENFNPDEGVVTPRLNDAEQKGNALGARRALFSAPDNSDNNLYEGKKTRAVSGLNQMNRHVPHDPQAFVAENRDLQSELMSDMKASLVKEIICDGKDKGEAKRLKCEVEPMNVLSTFRGNRGSSTTTTTTFTTSTCTSMAVILPSLNDENEDFYHSDLELSISPSVSPISNITDRESLSTLSIELVSMIITFIGNDYAKVAQVNSLFYKLTGMQRRDSLVSLLSAPLGVICVYDRFMSSFKDQKQGRLRDDLIAYLISLVRSCKKYTVGKDAMVLIGNHVDFVKMFLQFDRLTSDVYDLLFGRGAYKDKLIPEDLLQLQRLFAGNFQTLAGLISISEEHLDDLRKLLSMKLYSLRESKCMIMAKVLMGIEKLPMGPYKVLADSIHPNLMAIICELNSNAPFAVIFNVNNRLKSEYGQCSILADKLFDLIRHRVDMMTANMMSQRLGLPAFSAVFPMDLTLLFDINFTNKHQFIFKQVVQVLKQSMYEVLLELIITKNDEVTDYIKELMLAVVDDDLEAMLVDTQLQFHVIFTKDLTRFNRWDQVSPSLVALIANKLSQICRYISADQRRHILTQTAPNLLTAQSEDDLMVMTYLYLDVSDRHAFIQNLTPQQALVVLDIALNRNMSSDVKVLLDMMPQVIKTPLLQYVNEHPDYVPDVKFLPMLFLLSANDEYRRLNVQNVTENILYSWYNQNNHMLDGAENDNAMGRLDDFIRG